MFCSYNTFKSKQDAMTYFADVINRSICLNGKPIGSISVSPFGGSDKCRRKLGYQ